jgi:hypothetical protein
VTTFGIFATTRPNFNYFGHSHNYDATIKNFIVLVGLILHLISSINRLIHLIIHISHQISCILKVFYNDIGVYFNVCTKIIYMYTYVYVHIMNLKINIWIMNFLFKCDHWYFNSEIYYIYMSLKLDIWLWKLLFQLFNTLFEFQKFDMNMIFSI